MPILLARAKPAYKTDEGEPGLWRQGEIVAAFADDHEFGAKEVVAAGNFWHIKVTDKTLEQVQTYLQSWNPGLRDDADGNVIQPDPIPGPWHTDEWWSLLDRKQFFKIDISENVFRQHPISDKPKGRAVVNMGTYPNYQSGFGGDSCYLPTPITWYERSSAVMSKNTYIGISPENAYGATPPRHSYKGRCPTDEPPAGPMPPTDLSEYFTILGGEDFR